jgi:hypothetical protein
VLNFAVPKRDLISIASDFVAKNPRKYCICMGIFWIALGIFDLIANHLILNVLRDVVIFAYILTGAAWILVGTFKIGISKKSD